MYNTVLSRIYSIIHMFRINLTTHFTTVELYILIAMLFTVPTQWCCTLVLLFLHNLLSVRDCIVPSFYCDFRMTLYRCFTVHSDWYCTVVLLSIQIGIVPLFYCPFRLVLYRCFTVHSDWYCTVVLLSIQIGIVLLLYYSFILIFHLAVIVPSH
jgi:hypothetical protein